MAEDINANGVVDEDNGDERRKSRRAKAGRTSKIINEFMRGEAFASPFFITKIYEKHIVKIGRIMSNFTKKSKPNAERMATNKA